MDVTVLAPVPPPPPPPPTPPTLSFISLAATPTIQGVARVDSPLVASVGAWTPGTALGLQWFADGTPVSGAVGTTFTPGPQHLGDRLLVRVTGTLAGYLTTVRSASPGTQVVVGVLTSATPRIAGKTKVGKTLSARPGTWASGTTLTYRWLANGKAVKRGTRAKFALTRAVRGKRISVRVTASRPGYAVLTMTSARTRRVSG